MHHGKWGLFRSFPQRIVSPRVEAVTTATSVFTEYVLCDSVYTAHSSEISSTFQEATCLLRLVEVNKQVFAIILLNRNLTHAAQLSFSYGERNNNFVNRAGGGK